VTSSRSTAQAAGLAAPLELELPYRKPFNFAHLLRFLGARAVTGVEFVDEHSYARTLSLPGGPGTIQVTDNGSALLVSAQLSHPDDASTAVALTRRLFDLDADSRVIDAALSSDPRLAATVAANPGIRLPGSVSAPETLIRAIVGQQITVTQATTMLSDMAARMPDLPLNGRLTLDGRLTKMFPTVDFMAAEGYLLFRGPQARRATLRGAATAIESGSLLLDFNDDEATMTQRLQQLPGVGPWTANYVAMRVLGAPDVLLPNDSAIRAGAKKLGIDGPIPVFAEQFRPWRSYVTMHLWNANSPAQPTD
jgi:3-methyladenine DNA glycosylase/8-oxoguanine DNA glycosylase